MSQIAVLGKTTTDQSPLKSGQPSTRSDPNQSSRVKGSSLVRRSLSPKPPCLNTPKTKRIPFLNPSLFPKFLKRTHDQYIPYDGKPNVDRLETPRIEIHLTTLQVMFYYTTVRRKLSADSNNCRRPVFSN